MANVAKFISTRSFFQLGAELKREKYDHGNDPNPQLWLAFFISFAVFVLAVYALVKYWNVLPAWVVIVGIFLLFIPCGPLLTLALVYYTLGSKEKSATLVPGVTDAGVTDEKVAGAGVADAGVATEKKGASARSVGGLRNRNPNRRGFKQRPIRNSGGKPLCPYHASRS